MKNIIKKLKNNRGFVVLFAVTIASIVLSVSLGVANIAFNESKFSTSTRDTNNSFIAADTGSECALFYDRIDQDRFPLAGPATAITCATNTVTPTMSGDATVRAYDFTLSGLGGTGLGCAKVNVIKDNTSGTTVTQITSKGYNITGGSCGSASSNLIERELFVSYGGVGGGSPPPPPPPPPTNHDVTVALAGTGFGSVSSSPAGISCGATCVSSFAENSAVDLTASPNVGSSFTGWSGACSGTGTCNLTMDADKNVTATFTATPVSQISFVGGSSAASTTITIPNHTTNDLIIMFAYREGSLTAPSLPAGWTAIGTANGSGTCANCSSSRLAYRFSQAGGGTPSGTWTNATMLAVQVYRGAHLTTPIGANGNTGASSTTVTYPGITLNQTDGTSWVAGFAGHNSINTNLQNAPAGMSNKNTLVNAALEIAGHDTNAGVSSWSATNVSVSGTSANWRARTVEIISQ